MYCKHCGAEIIDGGKFCPKCGARDFIPYRETPDKQKSNSSINKTQDKTSYNQNTDTNKIRSNSKKGIVIAAVLAACVIVFVIFTLHINNKSSADQIQDENADEVHNDEGSESEAYENDTVEHSDTEGMQDNSKNTYVVPSDVLDFYGVWCASSENAFDLLGDAEYLADLGFAPKIVNANNWSNLTGVDTYIVSAGLYTSKSEADRWLLQAQEYYPNAYVMYSGSYIESQENSSEELCFEVLEESYYIDNLIDLALTRELNEYDLIGYTSFELSAARNGIYARHGYVFQSQEWNDFFSEYSWYFQDPLFHQEDVSPIEKKNAGIIRSYEESTFGGIYEF